ncbi:hypothetical protein J2X31_000399 [Flavobacterium arsenatis]|uniref:Uncharacterized protein n=1 Tax=Flavobacterium arsenatis TaxID=1484332 RepID=A0ABU1TKA6_9FLAO|nr:hypothetical protein [Flavobacterium arsenatis]MDR6966406.1 hypothetical protein [Flavobacterium arsenatis]
MTIQELINQQMNHFIGKLMAKNQLSIEKVIEVATHTGAYLIRNRHVQNKAISEDEIKLVLQSLTDFINHNFENQFHQEDFILIKDQTLALLKNPAFDQEIQEYFKQFYQ